MGPAFAQATAGKPTSPKATAHGLWNYVKYSQPQKYVNPFDELRPSALSLSLEEMIESLSSEIH